MATKAVSSLGPLATKSSKPADPSALLFKPKNIISVLGQVDYIRLPLLAVELGLEKELSEIEAAAVPDQVRKRLVEKWLQKYPLGHTNWEVLARALRSPIVRENKLAEQLEKLYVRRDSRGSTLSSSSGSEPYSPRSPISPASISTETKGMHQSIYQVPHWRTQGFLCIIITIIVVATKMRELAEVHVRDSFGSLVALLASKLAEKQSINELDITSFSLYLSNVFPPKALPNADDVLMIIRDINAQELWDYCQYEIVERIANRYLSGDTELTSAISEHREMVNNFLTAQCIADYIEMAKAKSVESEEYRFELRALEPSQHINRRRQNYYDRLAVKLGDVRIRKRTLSYVRQLWKGIQREFHLSDCNALLDHIYDGSIVIIWLIPPSASEAVLKPQPWSAIHFIQEESIVNMMLNDTGIYDTQVICTQVINAPA